MSIIMEADLPGLLYRGKVRDTYGIDDSQLLLIATDRASAFDVIMPNGIPDKGIVLNQLSAFWFEKTKHIVPNHVVQVVDDINQLSSTIKGNALPDGSSFPRYLERRSMVVKKAERINIECIVRGYISGSGWAEYKQKGSVCGIRLPEGLQESEKLPEPIFTPTTKADSGHDESITIEETQNLIGVKLTQEVADKSREVYEHTAAYALDRGIIIADTKMEFGIVNGQVILIDELLTPDSSRFWDIKTYAPGRSQPSFDKQPLRDWLADSGWNKEPPAPELPPDVIEGMANRYRSAYRILTGKEL